MEAMWMRTNPLIRQGPAADRRRRHRRGPLGAGRDGPGPALRPGAPALRPGQRRRRAARPRHLPGDFCLALPRRTRSMSASPARWRRPASTRRWPCSGATPTAGSPALVLGAAAGPVSRAGPGQRRLDRTEGRFHRPSGLTVTTPDGQITVRRPVADRRCPATGPRSRRWRGACGPGLTSPLVPPAETIADPGVARQRPGRSGRALPQRVGHTERLRDVLHRSRHRGAGEPGGAMSRSAWPGLPSGCRPSST